jgi:salicylate hydroxylase
MQGQGANMSIEDADSLRLLKPGTKREDVPSVLELVEKVRLPRIRKILAQTRETHKDFTVGKALSENMKFCYGYRGVWEALKELNLE